MTLDERPPGYFRSRSCVCPRTHLRRHGSTDGVRAQERYWDVTGTPKRELDRKRTRVDNGTHVPFLPNWLSENCGGRGVVCGGVGYATRGRSRRARARVSERPDRRGVGGGGPAPAAAARAAVGRAAPDAPAPGGRGRGLLRRQNRLPVAAAPAGVPAVAHRLP